MLRSFLRPAARMRLSTAFIATLAISLQFAEVAHLALEEHEVCAEHGQAVDTARSEHAHGAPATTATPAPLERAVRDGEGSHQGDHAHCPIVADHRDELALVPAAYAVGHLSPEAVAVSALDLGWTLAPRALRLRAPKTSPPA